MSEDLPPPTMDLREAHRVALQYLFSNGIGGRKAARLANRAVSMWQRRTTTQFPVFSSYNANLVYNASLAIREYEKESAGEAIAGRLMETIVEMALLGIEGGQTVGEAVDMAAKAAEYHGFQLDEQNRQSLIELVEERRKSG